MLSFSLISQVLIEGSLRLGHSLGNYGSVDLSGIALSLIPTGKLHPALNEAAGGHSSLRLVVISGQTI